MLARLVGNERLVTEYDDHHRRLRTLINDFWSDTDGIYYDRSDHEPFEFTKVRTPAAYCPLLADACSSEQAAALAALLIDPECFGGPVPWPSVARDDPAFRATGHYWRGGVWVPTAYMSARALGFRVDAPSATVSWQRHTRARAGIRRLRCGPVTADIVATGSTATVDLDGPLTLVINEVTFRLDAGTHSLAL